MKKVKELIDNNYISLEDIQDYLMSINKEIVEVKYLMDLEDMSRNHPG
jgi:hypothetical protein